MIDNLWRLALSDTVCHGMTTKEEQTFTAVQNAVDVISDCEPLEQDIRDAVFFTVGKRYAELTERFYH